MAAPVANGMRFPNRNRVIWLGPSTANADVEFTRRGLDLKFEATEAAVIAACRAGTRSVLVPFAIPQLRETLAHLFYPVLDSGASLSVVLPSEATQREDRAAASTALATLKKAQGESRAGTVKGWMAHELAEACASHEPGKDVGLSLVIDTTGMADALGDSHTTLLRRAFSDFAKIMVKPLEGSLRPGALVWRVDGIAKDDSRRYEPFVVKAGERSQITTELRTITDFVLDRIPFPHWAPIRPDRCVEGATERLLVSMFVDRAMRMDRHLREGSPRLAIAALFDGPLRTWRLQPRRERVKMAGILEDHAVLPKPGKLRTVFEKNVANGVDVREPERLMAALADLPALDVFVCHSHGDLHPNNIFLRRNSLDVVLIDFMSARYERPISCDPAMLDVSLGLWQVGDLTPLTEEETRDLFSWPLLPPTRLAGVDSRVEAIRQIRVEARGDGVTDKEYAVAVAAYMLRFAAYRPDEERAWLAYELADRLVLTMQDEPWWTRIRKELPDWRSWF